MIFVGLGNVFETLVGGLELVVGVLDVLVDNVISTLADSVMDSEVQFKGCEGEIDGEGVGIGSSFVFVFMGGSELYVSCDAGMKESKGREISGEVSGWLRVLIERL